jgi:hypothetical protein
MATRATAAQGTSDTGVEKVRAWAGLIAVVAGDLVIALAAILGITHFTSSGNSQSLPQIVAILSGAFTAISTMTTAYFGIKAISNTAKNLAGPPTGKATSESDGATG